LRDDFRDDTLPREVVAQLDTLPGWSWDPGQTSWERGLHALQAWLSDHGDPSPPQDAVIDDFPIGRWVHARRREHRAGKLPSGKSEQLEALPGWAWNVWDATWQHALRALQAYAQEHGTTRVPSSYAVGDIRLGQWTYHQRLLYRRGQLAPNRVAQLQALPGWTWNAQRSPGKK
jgi:helicase associated protein